MIVLMGVLSLRQSGFLIALKTVYQEAVLRSRVKMCDVRLGWMRPAGCRCTALRFAGGCAGVAAVDVPDAGLGLRSFHAPADSDL